MKQIEKKKGYLIHKTATKYILCKVLNEYQSEEEAQEDLINLLTHKKKERQILKEFSKNDVR